MTRIRIADICLVVEDLHRAIAFYRDILGFTLSMDGPTFAKFDAGAISLALWQFDAMTAQTALGGVSLSVGARNFVGLLVDAPDEVDRLYSRLSASGVVFEAPPRDFPWGARCCFFRDPDGHLWEVYAWAVPPTSTPQNPIAG